MVTSPQPVFTTMHDDGPYNLTDLVERLSTTFETCLEQILADPRSSTEPEEQSGKKET